MAKAYARIVDGRDPDRHAQDPITLAGIALFDPRAVISQQAQMTDAQLLTSLVEPPR